jgi:PTH1 family peptidyl-tRNA hydrolase
MSDWMKLIVGLGNPGKLYAKNRHNVGFRFINYLARHYHIHLDSRQAKARIGSGEIDGEPVVLAKPQIFINLSGKSISPLVAKFAPSLDDLLVVHDDLDLPLGKIRIRKGGSSGGHKGLASIITSLGSDDFTRLRLGIGRPEGNQDVVAYVLSDFTSNEEIILAETITKAIEAVSCLLSQGLTTAMNKYN